MREWDDFFRNLAVYGYFDNFQSLPEPDQTNIFIESYANGWLWVIPLHTGWASVGAVVDSAANQEEVQRSGPQAFLDGPDRPGPQDRGDAEGMRG